MKKLFVMFTVLCMILAGAALAENVPSLDFLDADYPQAEAGAQEALADGVMADQPETAEPAAQVSYSVPSGQRIRKFEPVENGALGVTIREWEIVDSVRAEEPDEYSVTYTALPGTKLMHVRYVFRYRGDDVSFNTITGAVVDGLGQTYPVALYLEGRENLIYTSSVRHDTPDCKSHSNSFLLPAAGSTKLLDGHSSIDYFVLCDFIAEIPESLTETDVPLYLTLKMKDTDYFILLER